METQASDQGALLRDVSIPLYQSKGWMKFLGVMSIIQGVVAAFTLVGIIIAWLPIWVGIILYQSASAMERAYTTGDREAFHESFGKLKTYFLIQGIITLIGIIIALFALSLGMLGVILEAVT
jgi:uncharacterized membrane protein HdeD (DUF308 family)